MSGAHHYTAYGLHIRSELALPHFGAAAPGEPDVFVRLGPVPRSLPEPKRIASNWQAAPGDFLLCVESKLRCRVTGGREITVERLNGVGDDLAAAWLMGSACTALLQQRGLLTLHASAVCVDAGAVLFLGNSGAGKSTLAAALAMRGFKVLADDVAAVRIAQRGPPLVWPGYPNMRLWADAFGLLGLPAGDRRRVRDGSNKYLLPAENFAASPRKLHAAYNLGQRNSETLEIRRATPVQALRILRRHTHRFRYADGFGNQEAVFRALANIARRVPIQKVTQPAGKALPDTLADCIERHLSSE